MQDMKRAEIIYKAELKELNKLEARLERQRKALVKAQAKAEKLGVAEWTNEEHNEWLSNVETVGIEEGYTCSMIKNKSDINKNGAWFGFFGAKRDIEETEKAIERCKARLDKKEEEYNEAMAEQDKEVIPVREDLIKETFNEMVKEWAKDGITLEGAVGRRFWGTTPQGKSFYIEGNSYGYTVRSLHCYTLTIDGKTIFTSGLFWRAYHVITKC